MSKYIVQSCEKLEGDLTIQGAKNAALPIMAACVLSGQETILHNVPDILDVRIMVKILTSVGCIIKREGTQISIDSRGLTSNLVSEQLVSQMRSSIMLMGALIAKQKIVQFSFPGGCDIGLRPIDIHLKGLKDLGASVREEHGYIIVDGTHIHAESIILDYPSVGATENLILAAVFAQGVTSISNAAKEPEIVDLQNFLNAAGARVYGAGTNTVYVEGVSKLSGCEYTIMPDRIVAGTMLCAANLIGGRVFFRDMPLDIIKAAAFKLAEAGMDIRAVKGGITASATGEGKAIPTIITQPYPGFPTDLQSPFAAMLSKADGISVIKETVFENRFKYTVQLARMGAKIKTEDRIAIITGVKKLMSATVYAEDLRGGAALILAGLAAEGETTVENASHINRGYDDLTGQFARLGAQVALVED